MKIETKRKIAKIIGIDPALMILTREQKRACKELKEQKKYEDIYQLFGSDAYCHYVPKNIRKAELKKLKFEGKYEDIRNKFGENQYNKLLIDAYAQELAEVQGNGKAFLWKTGMKIKKVFVKSSIYATMVSSLVATFGTAAMVSFMHADNVRESGENASRYESLIDDYNQGKDEYIKKEFEGKNYTHTQTFIKLMDDMWSDIDGYKEPTLDITGYRELDLTENGYGVCRNMAPDIAKKLQALGYEATPYSVYMGEDLDCSIVPIERTVLPEDEEEKEPEIHRKDDNWIDKARNTAEDLFVEGAVDFLSPLIGNHKVVFVRIPEDNLTLVLDPTNLTIGVYLNGHIFILNSNNLEDGAMLSQAEEYTPKPIGQYEDGSSAESIAKEYLRSFEKPTIPISEIIEKYGLVAQHDAYDFFVKLKAADRLEHQESAKGGQTQESATKISNKLSGQETIDNAYGEIEE